MTPFKLTETHVSAIRLSWHGFKRSASIRFNEAMVQSGNHKFLSSELKITCAFEESKQLETDHENGLGIIPHSLRLGGLRKKAVFENRHEKESPLSITSGLLSHGETNS